MRELAKSALGAPTFQGFISRWEINREPPPPQPEPEKRSLSSVAGNLSLDWNALTSMSRTMVPRLFNQQVRESEEEDSYFNSEDDEDPVVPVPKADTFFGLFRRRRQRISAPGPHTLMNKGQHSTNVPSQQQRPISPLSSLLEYDEDDDAEKDAQSEPSTTSATSPAASAPHQQIQIPPYEGGASDEPSDPEDDLLESLVSKAADGEPPPGHVPTDDSMRLPREKRRRGEEEEDDALERLAPKNRRISGGGDGASTPSSEGDEDSSSTSVASTRPSPLAISTGGKQGNNDEGGGGGSGPKKLKLRFAPSKSLLGAKATSIPVSTESKDGGNG